MVEETQDPQIDDESVLVSVGACGMCYTDIKIWKGHGVNTPLPHVLGHEVAGTVSRLGESAKGLKEGDRVVVYLYDTCGICEYCQSSRDNECINRLGYLGNNRWGGYAEYVSVRVINAIKIPPNLNFEEASLLADAGLTPYHAMVDRAQVRLNETAVLVGMGGLALVGLQILKLMGARVIAVSRTQSKLEMARELGADLIINSSTEDALKAVRDFTAGYGVDHVFDFVGSSETVLQDVKYVLRGGKILLLGYQSDVQMVPVRSVRGFFTLGGSSAGTREDLRKLVQLASEGKIKSIISKEYPLEEADIALNLLHRGAVNGRLVLRP